MERLEPNDQANVCGVSHGLPTGSVGQKPGRHLGRWKRGGIKIHISLKEISNSSQMHSIWNACETHLASHLDPIGLHLGFA